MTDTTTTDPVPVPWPVRAAGMLAIAESALVLVYSVFLIIRDVLGYRDPSAVFAEQAAGRADFLGVGTALCLILMFGGVAAAGVNYMRGGRFGRGPVFMLQILLLPVSWYIIQSGHWPVAVVVAAVALTGLYLLIHPAAVSRAQSTYAFKQ
ncbi:hypothetical protein ACFSSC_10810 [Corynebacterium mendelii]|uniref:Integral membrane protein n=1 Tax=Corynebacterium mendelii TaxID=2765362 RepID=A0A939IXV4_9CORY|nr:hypothetical protein [Corynebacterium mendelii]MBN9644453.1 hypothetical protein [Corynebacterium mendelii]